MSKANQTIGKYTVERELGRGTMGPLYLGYDPRLDRRAAIRVNVGAGADPGLQDRFFREARAIAKLDHPNIMKIWDLDVHENIPYVAMEFVEGEDLKAFIEKKHFVPFQQKLTIIIEVCRALQYVHSNGIFHGDIKPSNIRVDSDGKPKIIDFNLAQSIAANADRNDIVRLAGVLFEWITSSHSSETFRSPAVVLEPGSSNALRKIFPACAPELSEVLDRALNTHHDRPFSTCSEFAEALRACQTSVASQQEALRKEVDRLENEFDRYRTSLSELHIEHSDSSFVDRDSTDNATTSIMYSSLAEMNMATDYGVLLERHARVEQRLELLNERLRQSFTVVELLKTSYTQFKREEFGMCVQTLQSLLSICPLHIHAKRMLKACQVALDEGKQQKEYQGRRNSTLRQAREAIEQSQYARTLLIVNRVLEIEPTQLEAGLLRDVAREREALDASDKKRRISELLEACRVQLRAGEYDEALKASEELMKLSPEESEVLEQQKSLKRMIKPDSE